MSAEYDSADFMRRSAEIRRTAAVFERIRELEARLYPKTSMVECVEIALKHRRDGESYDEAMRWAGSLFKRMMEIVNLPIPPSSIDEWTEVAP